MNRSHLSLDTFDPAPLALGERTTRLVEPVNPRAAFEAFERGDHVVPGEAIPLGQRRATTININGEPCRLDIKAYQELVDRALAQNGPVHVRVTHALVNMTAGYAALAASFEGRKYPPARGPATYNDILDAAIRHQNRFGGEATRALLTRKFGTHRLIDLRRHQYAEAVAALNGPATIADLLAAPAPVALTPAQQHADELLVALKGAANYIDKLGGVSQSYRVLVNRVEATGQEGGA